MTTRTLHQTDTEAIIGVAADSVGELVATPAITSPTEPTSDGHVCMAAVVSGETLVFGISIDEPSLLALARTLLPDLDSEPDHEALEGTRLTIATQFFNAIEEAIGQPLFDVDPEPFDSGVRIEIGDAVIHAGSASIPVGAAAPGPPNESRLSSVRLDVSVELGRAKIAVKDLLSLDEGGVIRLGRTVGEPVDLVVNGTVTARGEIVVVDGRLGLRVTSLV